MAILERGDLEQPPATGLTPGFIPTEYATAIIQEAAKSSIALSSFRQVTIPTKSNSIPVLSLLPTASWVNGEPTMADPDAGKKSTTEQQWRGVVVTAETIAAVIVVPEETLDDASGVDLWAELTPRIAESIGAALDIAAFGGTAAGAPASFGNGILADAVAAGNVVVNAAPEATTYNDAFQLVEADGFVVKNVYAALDQKANFRGWNAAGIPVYLTDIRDDARVDSIYGVPVMYDEFGALGASTAVVGDGTKAIVGTRSDMTVKLLTESSIDVSPGLDGSQIVRLAQADSVALRIRARFGIAVANPVTVAQPNEANRYPFAVINSA